MPKNSVRPAPCPPPPAPSFIHPAEWEKHEATWFTWPHHSWDWYWKFAAIPWAFGELVRKITPGEKVRLLVNSKNTESRARRLLSRLDDVDMTRVEFFRIQTNRGWNRDCGPIFAFKKNQDRKKLAILRFRFNGWAKYKHFKHDDMVPVNVSQIQHIPLVPVREKKCDIVLEGGAIDTNGRGTLITTEECLLHPSKQARNPGMTKSDYEFIFQKYLGAKNTVWLGRGISGDDTHGHVDDVCRFVNKNTVVLCHEKNPADYNHAVLEENHERLKNARLENGSKLRIIRIPMPEPLYLGGFRLPASYANFYVCNAAVLVPTFNDPNDRVALGILSELFPYRKVVGIHAVDLVWGLGTLHCLTHEQPAVSL